MNRFRRLMTYLRAELWRPADSKVIVRKRRPGFGWTINLAALRERLRRR
jgi:hypothetical protein